MKVYSITLERDGDSFLVTCPALPEVATFGETEEEAFAQAQNAIEEALAARMARGEDIPPASATNRGPNILVPLLTLLKVELYQALRDEGMTRADLQRALGTHRPQVDRLFDLNHASRLDQMEAAFRALGRTVSFDVKAA